MADEKFDRAVDRSLRGSDTEDLELRRPRRGFSRRRVDITRPLSTAPSSQPWTRLQIFSNLQAREQCASDLKAAFSCALGAKSSKLC